MLCFGKKKEKETSLTVKMSQNKMLFTVTTGFKKKKKKRKRTVRSVLDLKKKSEKNNEKSTKNKTQCVYFLLQLRVLQSRVTLCQ